MKMSYLHAPTALTSRKKITVPKGQESVVTDGVVQTPTSNGNRTMVVQPVATRRMSNDMTRRSSPTQRWYDSICKDWGKPWKLGIPDEIRTEYVPNTEQEWQPLQCDITPFESHLIICYIFLTEKNTSKFETQAKYFKWTPLTVLVSSYKEKCEAK
jgi:hypothetical protein